MQRIEGIEIQRIRRGDGQPGVGNRQRDDPKALRQIARHHLDDVLRDGEAGDVHKVHRRMRRERLGHVLLGHDTVRDERLRHGHVRLYFRPRPVDLRFGREPVFEQDFEDVFVVLSHAWGGVKMEGEKERADERKSTPAPRPECGGH